MSREFLDHSETQNFFSLPLKSVSRRYCLLGLKPYSESLIWKVLKSRVFGNKS